MQADKLQKKMEQDYDVALVLFSSLSLLPFGRLNSQPYVLTLWMWLTIRSTTIRDKIIPHAVSWFTGEADGIAYSSDEDEDDDDDDDDEEQDDEDSFDE